MNGPPITMIGDPHHITMAMAKRLLAVAWVFGIDPKFAMERWGCDNLEAVERQVAKRKLKKHASVPISEG